MNPSGLGRMSTMATTAALRIGPADHGRRMTLEEFLDADAEEGYRYELARGVLEVTYVPDEWPHGLIVCALYDAISRYRQAHPGVIYRYGGGNEYRLWLPAMISGRNPDVAVTLSNTPKDHRGQRPPALVFEVVSEGSEARDRDYVAKRQEYLAYGLREYWIIDPLDRRVIVLIRDGDAWVERVFVDGQVAAGLALPGFAVPVADLWPAPEDREDGQD
jgi:Uma2 family endonuclease